MNKVMTDMKLLPGYEFLKYILENLVEDKDKLNISATKDEMGVLLTVQVKDSDMGKLIGKNGQAVKALRTLLKILGGGKERINLKVMEPASSMEPASIVE